MIERLLTVEQVAERLQVPVSWIYERSRHNALPLVRVGKYIRFRPEDLAQIIADGYNRPVPK
jgi:excisionase family DNA binding protein